MGQQTACREIMVKTSDNEFFELDASLAMEFGRIKSLFMGDEMSMKTTIVALPYVSSTALSKIINYCKMHMELRSKLTCEEEIKAFGAEFVKNLRSGEIKEMHIAAEYLNIKGLFELLSQTLADRIHKEIADYVPAYEGADFD